MCRVFSGSSPGSGKSQHFFDSEELQGSTKKNMFPDNYPRCFFSWRWKITCFSCQSIYTWTIFHSYLNL